MACDVEGYFWQDGRWMQRPSPTDRMLLVIVDALAQTLSRRQYKFTSKCGMKTEEAYRFTRPNATIRLRVHFLATTHRFHFTPLGTLDRHSLLVLTFRALPHTCLTDPTYDTRKAGALARDLVGRASLVGGMGKIRRRQAAR